MEMISGTHMASTSSLQWSKGLVNLLERSIVSTVI